MANKLNPIDIYMKQDGYYVGRMLKNGKLSANARRITETEILTMFTGMMRAYCNKTGSDNLVMKDAEGKVYVATKVQPTTEAEQG